MSKHSVERSFATQSMMSTLGAELCHVESGEVDIRAPILPGCQQQHGFAHAGLTFSIGDSAAGYAALSQMADGYEVLTTEMKINLLAPGKGEFLIAKGRVIKPGRRLVIVKSDIYAVEDEAETHIAIMMGTMLPVPLKD